MCLFSVNYTGFMDFFLMIDVKRLEGSTSTLWVVAVDNRKIEDLDYLTEVAEHKRKDFDLSILG